MKEMLKNDGPPPSGKWSDLEVLQPVKDYKGRHSSVLLTFDVLDLNDKPIGVKIVKTAKTIAGYGDHRLEKNRTILTKNNRPLYGTSLTHLK